MAQPPALSGYGRLIRRNCHPFEVELAGRESGGRITQIAWSDTERIHTHAVAEDDQRAADAWEGVTPA